MTDQLTKAEAEDFAYWVYEGVRALLVSEDPEQVLLELDCAVWRLISHGYNSIAWRLTDDIKFELNKYWSVQWGMD